MNASRDKASVKEDIITLFDYQNVHVRLFGALELENQYGCIQETPGRQPLLFLLLKYLLVNPQHRVEQSFVLQKIWNDTRPDAENKSAVRVRLRRLREMLAPMQLDSTEGLIHFEAGEYSVNPEYILKTDADLFQELIGLSNRYAMDHPLGLKLALDAIELFRGPFLEYTDDTEWLTPYRSFYHKELEQLIRNVLIRMNALGAREGLDLLCNRAAAIIPDAEGLHKEILHYLTDCRDEEDLTRYLHQLETSGKADSLQEKNVTFESIKSHRIEKEDSTTDTVDLSREDPLTVHVKLFGEVELKNTYGKVVENRARQPLPFSLIKYLLIEPDRTASLDNLLEYIWPASSEGVNELGAAQVRLRRAREALRPLNLDKKKGLLRYQDGLYSLNPAFRLDRDVDQFANLMNQIEIMPIDDPTGLQTCVKALELYRGPLMEYTADVTWLEPYREHYRGLFCRLVRECISRMKALQTDDALCLLCQRSAAIVPEERDLHMEIISLLAERKQELELTRHITHLTHSGRAQWLKDLNARRDN